MIKNILLAIDFSDLAARILEVAREMATALNARVWIIHVADPNPFFLDQDIEPMVLRQQHEMEISREQQELEAMETYFRKNGIEATACLKYGVPVPSIMAKAKEVDASLIIIGKENHGFFHKTLLGSVSEGVVEKACCPVLVVPIGEDD